MQFGIAPQLAALEALVNPSVAELLALNAQAAVGHARDPAARGAAGAVRLEPSRVVPVRVTEFSITEEAFDAALNPIRAKVSLGLRVMTTDDLGFAHRGGTHLHQPPAHARGAGRQDRRGVAAVARLRPTLP